MADKGLMFKTRIENLLADNKPFIIYTYTGHGYPDVVHYDTGDDYFLRMIVKWKEFSPALRSFKSRIPIGLVQLTIPYEEIMGLFEYDIEQKLLDDMRPDILHYFKNTNIEEGADVSQWYGDKRTGEKTTPNILTFTKDEWNEFSGAEKHKILVDRNIHIVRVDGVYRKGSATLTEVPEVENIDKNFPNKNG